MSSSRSIAVGVVVLMVAAIVTWVLWPGQDVVLPPKSKSKTSVASSYPLLTRPESPAADYVGSQVCRRCHEDIYQTYQSHPMAHATSEVMHAPVIEDYQERNSLALSDNETFSVERTADSVVHRHTQLDAEGQTAFDQRVKVDLAIGSGKRGRSYAFMQNGRMFQTPLTWYTERNRWDLSPGYESRNKGFERRLVEGCVVCHTGRVAVSDAKDVFEQPLLLEGAISCERCHGPAKRHVQRYEAPDEFAGHDPIVNPARLDPTPRESVCIQCHLSGHAKITRYGRRDHDFRPGQDFSDIWVAFVRGNRVGSDGATEAVSHVEQMRSSTCFTQSVGKLGCISCHDPHSSPSVEEKPNFYRAKCASCHVDDTNGCSESLDRRMAPGIDNSCVQCHMPKLPASDVPHTSQTDHRVLRRPAAKVGAEHGQIVVFDQADKRIAAAEFDRAKGLMLARDAQRSQDAIAAEEAMQWLEQVLPAVPDDTTVLHAIGSAASVQGDFAKAKEYWERTLKLDKNHENALANLARLAHDSGELQQGVAYLERLFKLNSWHSSLNGRMAHMLGQLGESDRAIKAARRGLQVNPEMIQVREWLVNEYEKRGEVDLAKRQREILKVLSD